MMFEIIIFAVIVICLCLNFLNDSTERRDVIQMKSKNTVLKYHEKITFLIAK